ncbi:unnamed protein product [Peniophora sp. CBMAI 1063]|nr:unnamed protein product [Peniophora sp. CBMAI 1063]
MRDEPIRPPNLARLDAYNRHCAYLGCDWRLDHIIAPSLKLHRDRLRSSTQISICNGRRLLVPRLLLLRQGEGYCQSRPGSLGRASSMSLGPTFPTPHLQPAIPAAGVPHLPSTCTFPVRFSPAPSSTLPTPVSTAPLPAMPRHWRNDYSNNIRPVFLRSPLRGTFILFCLIAYGQPNLATQWRIIHDTRAFLEEKSRLARNIGTVNIVAALLLATTATFVTTQPPRTDIFDYTQLGSAAQFVLSSCTQALVLNTLMGTRFRVWVIMSSLVYPFFAIGAAASANIFGLLSSAWTSEDSMVKVASSFLFAVPILLLVLFLSIVKDFDDDADSEGAQTM